jgi:Ca-activated chloride channel family protein
VSFGDAWALAGLVLLAPIIALHLRDRGRPVRDVPSLLLWQQLATDAPAGKRRLGRPILPFLLALQALGLILLVLALADPLGGGARSPRTAVFVLDDSFWMRAGGRVQTAASEITRAARAQPPGTLVRVVVASPAPRLAYRGSAGGVGGALARVRPTAAPPDLGTALSVAAGLLTGPHDRIVVVHAPEDAVPAVDSAPGELSTLTAGAPIADQGIFATQARCGIGATDLCAITAVLRNSGDTAVDDHYLAAVGGRRPLALSSRVAPRSSADIALIATPGERVDLRLQGSDPLAIDDRAWVNVPYQGGAPRASVVTLVGERSRALALARAFAAVPGVKLRLLTPSTYRPADARGTGLIVLDGWLPRAGLPPAPSVLLVDPPRLPGGHVGAPQQDSTLSGSDQSSPLLAGVNLSSLTIDTGSARQLTLPGWLTPVAWSPAGPLIAAGGDGRQRVAIISFEPSRSNLPQLASFPIMAANLVTWGLRWAPASAVAGTPTLVDAIPGATTASLTRDGAVVARAPLDGRPVALTATAPGLYALAESGPGVSDRATVAVDLAEFDGNRHPSAACRRGPDAEAVACALGDHRHIGRARPRMDLLAGAPAGHRAMIAFGHPLVLLLVLAIAGLAEALRRRYARSLSRRTVWPVLVLPVLALVLLVVALADPRVGSTRPTALVVQPSASNDQRTRAIEHRWTARFADHCRVSCRTVRVSGDTANLESALRTALGLTPAHGRVIVVGDGAQGQGDLLTVAAAARRRDVAVDWVPVVDAHRRDAAVTAISVPAAVHVGDTVPLSVTVTATVAGRATLRVRRDGGAATAQSIDLRRGDNPLLLLYTATRTGSQSFEVTIAQPDDTVSANDTAAAVTHVSSAPRVLVVGDAGSPVPQMLAGQRLRLTAIAPGAMPSDVAAYSRYDQVVLDDLSAKQLSSAQVVALDDAVREGGLGLLVLGGPHAFSLGGYWRSPLQQILPVSSRVPGNLQRRNLAIELVLDHSGSMIDRVGGVPKIVMARSAARETAAFIAAHHDQLGIVDFDIVPHTLLPMQTVVPGASHARVNRTIETLHASGGTNIYLGLKAGLTQLLTSTAKVRHLILLTDGISVPSNYQPLFTILRKNHISVATVALGADADRPLLKTIAGSTGGTAYVTDSAKQLPHIFVKETQLAAKPVRVSGKLQVYLSNDSPIVRSLSGHQLPPVRGNVVVNLKRGAQADLLASGKGSQLDPALAEWQVGTGRVVAWTPGVGAPWGVDWLRERSLFNDAVRWSERGVNPAPLTPTTSGAPAGTLQIDLANLGTATLGVTMVSGTLTPAAGGRSHTVDFARVAPGLYQASTSSLLEGVYRFALATRGSDRVTSTGEVALPYPVTLSPVSVTTSPLGQLVTQTGGRRLAVGNVGILASTYSLRGLLTLIALIVFFAGAVWRMAPDIVDRLGQRLAHGGAGAASGQPAGSASSTEPPAPQPDRVSQGSSETRSPGPAER